MKRISNLVQLFRTNGLFNTLKLILRKYSVRRLRNYRIYQELFYNKCGIEIGGPSDFFKNEVPIYSKIKSLDGININSTISLEGELFEGENYKFGNNKIGYQYICDALNLDRIESGKFDFVLSCNSLEHIANPLKALSEWLRIIKPKGLLFLVLPNKNSNFDHNRNITSIEHLLEDFNNNISEEDLTHLDDILTLHDLSMDISAGDFLISRKDQLIIFKIDSYIIMFLI